MANFIPHCIWRFNCYPGPDDYDFFATWGNLTIQRDFLRYVKSVLNFYNQIDGWIQKSKTFTPPDAPTSEPFTFNAELGHSWCKINCDHTIYFGKTYKFNTSLFILSGGVGQHDYLDQDYIFDSDDISHNLKFCKTDPCYVEVSQACTDLLPDCL